MFEKILDSLKWWCGSVIETKPPIELTVDKVTTKLLELPDTSDKIAAKLTELGIKGYRGASVKCPIAVYLNEDLDDYKVAVGLVSCTVWETEAKSGSRIVYLPGHISNFISNFDSLYYPGLME